MRSDQLHHYDLGKRGEWERWRVGLRGGGKVQAEHRGKESWNRLPSLGRFTTLSGMHVNRLL